MTIDTSAYRPHIQFSFSTDDFEVKIAENESDINNAQRLRHKIFLEEGLGTQHESGRDFDKYDQIADHLMILDNTSGEAIGTYRLINSQFANSFYSQNEFYLDDFLAIDGIKLEMGRACTHMDFRNGRTMDLLWQGLSKYISLSETRFLFGCSSVNTADPQVMFSMLKAIANKDKRKTELNIHPIGKYRWPDDDKVFASVDPMPGFTKELPPLLRSYLHAGSFVHGMPAYDADFSCFDLLTILDLTQLTSKFQARYNPTGQS